MALESGTYISDLNPSNPVGATDKVSTLDDHIRLIKATLQTTFPGISGEVSATHTELNFLDGVTGTTGAGKLVLDDTPTIADLTVTDSITLPAASVADAALSDNIPKLDASTNTFTGSIPIIARSGGPRFVSFVDGVAEDQGGWLYGGSAQGGNFRFFIATTADSAPSTAVEEGFVIRRNGTTVTEVELNATTLDFNGNADISGTLDVGGNATVLRLRTAQGSDASLSSTNHPFQLGLSDGPNLIADINEIMARDNGAAADIAINADGGNVLIGHSSSTVSVPGALTVTGAATAGTAATSTSSTLVAGQIHHRSANTTVPSMNAGQWVAVQNTSTSSITLSEGSGVTLELGGTTTTGNRTLLAKGFAFVYFRANGVGVVHGNGVV